MWCGHCVDSTVYMLPALRGRACFRTSYYSGLSAWPVAYLPRFLFEWTGSILYGYSSFRQIACLYFCFLFVLVLLYCVSYLLFLRGGVSDWWWGGGPVLQFSPVGHLSILGLGICCSCPADVRCVLSSAFLIAGGDSVAPDRFASSDVCLGGSCRGVLARCHEFSRGLVVRACVDMCSGVGFMILEKADVFWIHETQRE